MSWTSEEQKRAYFEKNKDKLNANARLRAAKYRKAHPGRQATAVARSYQKHKAKRQAEGRESARKWREKNRERHRQMCREWAAANKARCAANAWIFKLRKKYGITPADYQLLFEEQKGKCAIVGCGRLADHIDHCHERGIVRGLLCKQCNWAIGYLGESTIRAAAIIEYLRKHNGS